MVFAWWVIDIFWACFVLLLFDQLLAWILKFQFEVIAANGGVQIIGAQGKKVVISNILGQTVANTVITSSDAKIAGL